MLENKITDFKIYLVNEIQNLCPEMNGIWAVCWAVCDERQLRLIDKFYIMHCQIILVTIYVKTYGISHPDAATVCSGEDHNISN